jgi:hypothetical protein
MATTPAWLLRRPAAAADAALGSGVRPGPPGESCCRSRPKRFGASSTAAGTPAASRCSPPTPPCSSKLKSGGGPRTRNAVRLAEADAAPPGSREHGRFGGQQDSRTPPGTHAQLPQRGASDGAFLRNRGDSGHGAAQNRGWLGSPAGHDSDEFMPWCENNTEPVEKTRTGHQCLCTCAPWGR